MNTMVQPTSEEIFKKVYGKSKQEVQLEWARNHIVSMRYEYENIFGMDRCQLQERKLANLRGKLIKAISEYIDRYYDYLEVEN